MASLRWFSCIFLMMAMLFSHLLWADAENLVRNFSFEKTTVDNTPPGWTLVHWDANSAVVGEVDKQHRYQGAVAFRIDVPTPDDARIEQVIPVLANQWYRFSAWVKTQNVSESGVGANLSVIDAMEHSPDIKGSQDWQQVQVWGKTGDAQTSITLAARLGFYGGVSTGSVWFDDIQVIAVDAPPYGAPQMLLTPPAKKNVTASTSGFLMNSAVILFSLLFVGLAITLMAQRQALAALVIRPWQLLAIGLLALSFKLVLAGYFLGYSADVNTFSAWAMDLYQHGIGAFYRPDYFADYPPAYMYLLWCVGAIFHHFQLTFATPTFLMVLKLPAILADIAAAYWLYSQSRLQSIDRVYARIAALLWLFNPLVILTSSVWGQVDSIFTLVLVIGLVAFVRAQLNVAAACYAMAILLKPQALLLGPLALLAFIRLPHWRAQLQIVAIFTAVAVLFILPFAWHKDSPFWIVKLYAGTLGSYPFLTLNAFNLYTLLNANWLPLETTLLGVGVAKWAWVLVVSGLLPIFYIMQRTRVVGAYLWAAAAIIVVFFVLGPKMHERYLFPAALLTLVSWLWLKDIRLFGVAIGFSITCFINTWVTLDLMVRLNTSFVPYDQLLLPLISFANVSLAFYLLYIGWQMLIREKYVEFSPQLTPSVSASLPLQTITLPTLGAISASTRYQLVAICGVYALVAFFDLGSWSSPQHPWKPLAGSDAVLLDTGRVQSIPVVEWHHGLGTGEYALTFSEDGQHWQASSNLKQTDRFGEFRWRQQFVNVQARYLQVEPVSGELNLNEIVLRDAQGQQLPLQKITGPDAALALIDEQKTAVIASTAQNGMYFDEIYHARSAWEILNGIDASENTHPPLGKIIIALGIYIFGMNPFGFRLMGTLFGVLMLPIMFSIARRVLHSDRYALIATAFFALDFMHFTQTRIATIDTYGVFFILASSYYLLRFLQHEPSQMRWRVDYQALLWGGLWFSVGVASKWIVIYAGVGLAALFAWQVGRQYLQARSCPSGMPAYFSWLSNSLLLGVLGFVILPIIIMCVAYWPHLHVSQLGLGEVWKSQLDMWNYHSKIQDSHPYSSYWYEWPLMLKPIWYYVSGQWFAQGQAAGIVAFGNPLIWYLGSLAFVVCLLVAIWQVCKNKLSLALGFIVISGLAQYLPWALIPRQLVFIYHFFASVPFIILALVWCLRGIERRWQSQFVALHYLSWLLVGIAGVLFVVYYPVISGFTVSREWTEWLRQLPPLVF
jgi:Gpi18-like mannosyltransferase